MIDTKWDQWYFSEGRTKLNRYYFNKSSNFKDLKTALAGYFRGEMSDLIRRLPSIRKRRRSQNDVIHGYQKTLPRHHRLRAHEYRFAVCGYNVSAGKSLVCLEAAHIKWHQAGGPDVLKNAIALFALHRKLFDRGGVFPIISQRGC